MTVSLGSNILSLRARRSLDTATERVASSYEKLSSGQRINRAGDDAAGLAIADSLRTKARLQTKGIQNINDGLSALNIIAGTLGSQSTILQRLAELASQAANGAYSATQRASLGREYNALTQEFGRLGETTVFNSLALLKNSRRGGTESFSLQVGTEGDLASMIRLSTSDNGSFSGVIHASDLVDPSLIGSLFNSTEEFINAGRAGLIVVGDKAIMFGHSGGASIDYEYYTRNPSTGAWTSSTTGVLTLDSSTGKVDNNGVTLIRNTIGADISALRFSGASGSGLPELGGSTSIDSVGIEGVTAARIALDVVSRRITEHAKLQGTFGAVESRLRYASEVLMVSREASTAAESRIRDVDVASETASLVASRIQQEAATQVLALSNSQPEILLGLLKA